MRKESQCLTSDFENDAFCRNQWFSNQIIVLSEVVMLRITPEGVDGSGPLYERVAVIADDWLKEHGLA